MNSGHYLDLLRQARRVVRRADEAEDLVQTALLAAIEAGRIDLADPDNRRWLAGTIRRRAAFDARTAARRRARETHVAVAQVEQADPQGPPLSFVATLSPALRTTALLALTGHTRREIAWLLDLSDPALRQRIAEIRKLWRRAGGGSFSEIPGLSGTLRFGQVRKALMHPVMRGDAVLASHDPDGNLFVISSRSAHPRQRRSVNTANQE